MRGKERQLLLTIDDDAVDLPVDVQGGAREVMARLLLRVLGLDRHGASDDAAIQEGRGDDPRS